MFLCHDKDKHNTDYGAPCRICHGTLVPGEVKGQTFKGHIVSILKKNIVARKRENQSHVLKLGELSGKCLETGPVYLWGLISLSWGFRYVCVTFLVQEIRRQVSAM